MNYVAADGHFFMDSPGGSGRVAWTLANVLADRGHRVALLCGSGENDPGEGRETLGRILLVRYRHPRLHPMHPMRLSALISAARTAAHRYLSDVRWDVVHSHGLASGLGAFAALGENARRLATVHSPAVAEARINWADGSLAGRVKSVAGAPLLALRERKLLRLAHEVSALSQYTRSCVSRDHGQALASKIRVLPWWADDVGVPVDRAAARLALGWPADAPVLFTLRRLVRRMGIDTAVHALREAARTRSDIRLFVAGEGPERDTLERLARDSGLAHAITFMGRITDADAALAYSAADAFILPSRDLECFGLIALEAMSRGTPVLAASVGAIPELFGDLTPGCLFPPGDSAALGRLLQRWLSGSLVLPSGAELRRHVHQTFGRERLQREYVSWIEGVAREDRCA